MKPIFVVALLLSTQVFSQPLGSGTSAQPMPSLNAPTAAQPGSFQGSGIGTAVLPPSNLGSTPSFPNSGVSDANTTFNTQSFDPLTGQPTQNPSIFNFNTAPNPVPQNQDLIFGTPGQETPLRQSQEEEPNTNLDNQRFNTLPQQDTNLAP